MRKGELKSERLIALVSKPSETEIGLLPDDTHVVIHEFEQLIKWKRVAGSNNAEVPEPQSGIDEEFDGANEAVNEAKAELQEFLVSIQKRYRDRRITFSHAKNRYEIEIPEEHVKGNKKPHDFELVS